MRWFLYNVAFFTLKMLISPSLIFTPTQSLKLVVENFSLKWKEIHFLFTLLYNFQCLNNTSLGYIKQYNFQYMILGYSVDGVEYECYINLRQTKYRLVFYQSKSGRPNPHALIKVRHPTQQRLSKNQPQNFPSSYRWKYDVYTLRILRWYSLYTPWYSHDYPHPRSTWSTSWVPTRVSSSCFTRYSAQLTCVTWCTVSLTYRTGVLTRPAATVGVLGLTSLTLLILYGMCWPCYLARKIPCIY